LNLHPWKKKKNELKKRRLKEARQRATARDDFWWLVGGGCLVSGLALVLKLRAVPIQHLTLSMKTGILGYLAYMAVVYDKGYGTRYKRIELEAQEIVKEEEEVFIKAHEPVILGTQDLPSAEERERKREQVTGKRLLRQEVAENLKEKKRTIFEEIESNPGPIEKKPEEVYYELVKTKLTTDPLEPDPDYVPEANPNLQKS